MKNTALIIASIMSKEIIVDMLSEALTEHKMIGTKDSEEKLVSACALMLTKAAVEKTPGGLQGVMTEMDKLERGRNLLTPTLG